MKLRLAILAALLLLASPAMAKVYYVNQGVKYHIGDDRFARSTDEAFVGTYPVVGQQWIQAFTVDRPDRVRVRIEHVWAVDDCDYCKDLVWIDDALMGRLYAKDNGKGFESLDPLVHEVVPGKVYYLKVESVGLQADDFVIENVIVESDKAEVTMMEPGPILKQAGDPMPRIYPPLRRSGGICEGLLVNHNWMLGWSQGVPSALTLGAKGEFKPSPAVVSLKKGQAVDLEISIQGKSSLDAVSQPLECLVGEAPFDGWAMLFSTRREAIEHGNLILGGDYTGKSFEVGQYQAGRSNRFALRRCADGTLRLLVNGRELAQSIPCSLESAPVAFRAQGLDVTIKSAAEAQPGAAEGLPASPGAQQ
jgi:hypothetical protein